MCPGLALSVMASQNAPNGRMMLTTRVSSPVDSVKNINRLGNINIARNNQKRICWFLNSFIG